MTYNAYQGGINARRKGYSKKQNPFEVNTPYYRSWTAGWTIINLELTNRYY